MLHTTRWSPDTCGCVLLGHTDDENPDWFACEVEGACETHAGLGDVDGFLGVYAENSAKNIAVGAVADKFDVAPGEVAWEFDEGRQVTLRVDGVDDAEVAAVVAESQS